MDPPPEPAPGPYPTSALHHLALAIVWAFPALALVVLSLRLYSKASYKGMGIGFVYPMQMPRTLGLDDVLACLSMLFSIGLTIASHYYVKYSYMGIDFDDIPPHDPKKAFVALYFVHILYFPVLGFVKSSVLFFLLRLGGQKRGVRLAIHALNIINIAMTISVLVTSAAQCRPVAFNWDKTIPGGQCIDQSVFYIIQSVMNILTDFTTLGIPIFIFRHLKMARRLKIAILNVFLLGFLVTLIAIARLVFLYIFLYTSLGFSQNFTMSFCLSAIETNLAIVCACAPTLRGLLRTWFPRSFHPAAPGEDGDIMDLYSETGSRSVGGGGGRNSTRYSGSNGDGPFYTKEGRGKVICNHAEVRAGLALSPSEEEIMAHNGIVRTTNVEVRHGGQGSPARLDTGEGEPVKVGIGLLGTNSGSR